VLLTDLAVLKSQLCTVRTLVVLQRNKNMPQEIKMLVMTAKQPQPQKASPPG